MAQERFTIRYRIIDIAESHFGEWVTVTEIADQLNVNRASIVRTIHRGLPSHLQVRPRWDTGETEIHANTRAYLHT